MFDHRERTDTRYRTVRSSTLLSISLSFCTLYRDFRTGTWEDRLIYSDRIPNQKRTPIITYGEGKETQWTNKVTYTIEIVGKGARREWMRTRWREESIIKKKKKNKGISSNRVIAPARNDVSLFVWFFNNKRRFPLQRPPRGKRKRRCVYCTPEPLVFIIYSVYAIRELGLPFEKKEYIYILYVFRYGIME